ncbi:GNAT family N-acetyltransferase [Phenylobacterium sp.]|uniref:GNAT family N-acetyltransferase n=1 Tax=Phenylobacterium sp. TaxID=1871053 RepID=UPI0035B35A2E
MIETERLILRPWREADREGLFRLNNDPRVGAWLAGPLDRAGNDALMARLAAHQADHGFSFWTAERRSDGAVVGMIGLAVVKAGDLPVGPAVEIGWRLVPAVWGDGYATEGAQAALDWGFANLDVDEIIAFTARTNLASQAVMRRIGMTPDPARDFDHPRLAVNHPLRAHVVFAAERP